MSTNGVRERTNRTVTYLAAAYFAGLAVVITLIILVDSGRGVGFAIAWILVVLFYARNALRCPLCGASVLNAPVGTAIAWLKGPDRSCPRCRADYHEAVATRAAASADPETDRSAN